MTAQTPKIIIVTLISIYFSASHAFTAPRKLGIDFTQSYTVKLPFTNHPSSLILNESSLDSTEEESIGNLVADDEWNGLGMELTEVVRVAIIEDVKKSTSGFIGKDDYKVGYIIT